MDFINVINISFESVSITNDQFILFNYKCKQSKND